MGPFLSERRDSNSRPSRWQRDALPAELLSHFCFKIVMRQLKLYNEDMDHKAHFG